MAFDLKEPGRDVSALDLVSGEFPDFRAVRSIWVHLLGPGGSPESYKSGSAQLSLLKRGSLMRYLAHAVHIPLIKPITLPPMQ